MLKKTISALLAAAVLTAAAPVTMPIYSVCAKEVDETSLVSVSELGEDYIVVSTDAGRQLQLNLSDDTVIIDSETKTATDIGGIQKGDKLLCEYSQAMTKSIPPQTSASLIATNVEKGGSVVTVNADKAEKDSDGNVVVTDNDRNLELTVSKDAAVKPYKTKNIVKIDDIKNGTKMLAWYETVTMSLPAKAYTENVVLLGEKTEEDMSSSASDWAKEDIKDAETIGMFDGTDLSCVNDITREEFSELAYNMLDANNLFNSKSAGKTFADTDNKKITALAASGVISGKSDTEFAPKDLITREEAAAIICRAASLAGVEASGSRQDKAYSDDDKISDWAKSSVYTLEALKVMSGTDTGFAPKSNITVEQSAAVLMRLHRLIGRVEITDSFADKLNREMPKDENYMFSPASVKMALAMAANGADGETKDQILKVLGIDNLDNYNESAKKLISSESDVLKLNVANSIWLNTDRTNQKFSKEFSDKMTDFYSAESGTVTDKDAAKLINAWVDKNTSGKIPTIIDEKDTDFEAMLVNAVYFKAAWTNKFDKNETKKDTFTDKDGKQTDIDFMNRTDWMNASTKDGVTIVELPYLCHEDVKDANGNYVDSKKLDMDVSMYLISSDKEFDAEAVLNNTELSREYVSLSMPKFKIEYSTALDESLVNMGIDRAFTEQAQFENMFDGGNMQITDVLHKTYIDVDENGTEAAAVTSIGMEATSLPPEPTAVKFDKPFTFVIRDKQSGEILFMGAYMFAK